MRFSFILNKKYFLIQIALYITDEKNQTIFELTHGLLPPKTRIKSQAAPKTIWKPSIIDSINSSILKANNVADLQTKYKLEFCKKYDDLKLKHQPVIGIVESEFFIIFDSIFYKIPSFITALDVIFKIFFVLNIEYPVESVNVWKFLEHFFFEINISDISSDIRALISQLDHD